MITGIALISADDITLLNRYYHTNVTLLPSSFRRNGGGGTVFTGVCLSTFRGGGMPHPSQCGGILIPAQDMGVPHPRSGQGIPWGTPPMSRWGASSGWGEGYPQPEQHNMYLLRGGRYASWVHAGGLSCVKEIWRSEELRHQDMVKLTYDAQNSPVRDSLTQTSW